MLKKSLGLLKTQKMFFGKHPIKLPAYSPTMTEGKITQWNAKVGDKITEGQSIALIETDKAQVDLEVTDEMYIAQILKTPEDGMVKVNEIIGWAVDDPSELKNFKADESSPSPSKVPKQAQRDSQKQEEHVPAKEEKKHTRTPKKKDTKKLPVHDLVNMPALSPTMESGKLLKWKVKEGDKIVPGDGIAEIETDKANLDLEVQDEGYVAKILTQAGPGVIKVGEPLLIMVPDKESVKEFKDYQAGQEH